MRIIRKHLKVHMGIITSKNRGGGMWFENAIDKEQIRYLFADDFLINELLLDMVIFEGRHLKFMFSCKEIPKVYPVKWKRSDFNALELEITMHDILSFESKGVCSSITCSPKITTEKDFSIIQIEHPDLYIYCKAKHLLIGKIKPYMDDRWD